MNNDELIKYCRYYKGEEHNPFDKVDQDKAMLWFYEMCFVLDKSQAMFDEYISDYKAVGLSSFAEVDGIPIKLKALLFNRYARGAQSMRDAVEPFKKFYLEYYGNE